MIDVRNYELLNNIPKDYLIMELNLTAGMSAFVDVYEKELYSKNYTAKVNHISTPSDITDLLKNKPNNKHAITFADLEVYYQFNDDDTKSLVIARIPYRQKLFLFYHKKVHSKISKATTQDGVMRSLCTNGVLDTVYRKGVNIDHSVFTRSKW